VARSWKSQIADEVRATSMMKPKWPEDAMAHIASLQQDNDRLRQRLSEAEKREARSPFEIVADWHDKQARTFKEMAQDVRAGELGRAKAVEASKHHAGSAAALRLHVLNDRRAALERSEG